MRIGGPAKLSSFISIFGRIAGSYWIPSRVLFLYFPPLLSLLLVFLRLDGEKKVRHTLGYNIYPSVIECRMGNRGATTTPKEEDEKLIGSLASNFPGEFVT